MGSVPASDTVSVYFQEELRVESLGLFLSFRIVQLITGMVKFVYTIIKNHNKVTNLALTSAEKMAYRAVIVIFPLVVLFRTPIEKLDIFLCHAMDFVADFFPRLRGDLRQMKRLLVYICSTVFRSIRKYGKQKRVTFSFTCEPCEEVNQDNEESNATHTVESTEKPTQEPQPEQSLHKTEENSQKITDTKTKHVT